MEYKFIPVFFFYVAFIAGLSRGHVEKTNYIEVVTHCRNTCSRYSKISGAYNLEVCSPLSISRKKIDNQITEIVDIIRNNLESINSYCVISNSKPIPWSFSKMDNFEMEIYDNPEGVGVIFIENSVEITPDNFLKEYEEVKYELTRLILSASNKFEFVNCQDCIKILLVENYCEFYIDEELMSKMVSEIQLPENIEQLWFVEPEWINDDEYKISYTQVYGNNI